MVSRSILAEASLLSEEEQFGPLVETYQTQPTRSGNMALWGVIITVLLLIGLLVGGFLWLALSFMNDPFFFSGTFILTSIVLPFSLFVIVILFGFWQFRSHETLATSMRRKIVVSIYTGGLAYREGRKRQVVRWEQILSVTRLGINRRKASLRYYNVKLSGGDEIKLPPVIAQVQKLGATIEQEMIKRLLPAALTDYAANKPLVFPGLCLNREMISNSDESLPWSEIERITISAEKFFIKARGVSKDWFNAPTAQFRNMCVLEALLGHIREERGDSLEIVMKE